MENGNKREHACMHCCAPWTKTRPDLSVIKLMSWRMAHPHSDSHPSPAYSRHAAASWALHSTASAVLSVVLVDHGSTAVHSTTTIVVHVYPMICLWIRSTSRIGTACTSCSFCVAFLFCLCVSVSSFSLFFCETRPQGESISGNESIAKLWYRMLVQSKKTTRKTVAWWHSTAKKLYVRSGRYTTVLPIMWLPAKGKDCTFSTAILFLLSAIGGFAEDVKTWP